MAAHEYHYSRGGMRKKGMKKGEEYEMEYPMRGEEMMERNRKSRKGTSKSKRKRT